MNVYNIFWFFVAAIAAAIPIPFIKFYTETHNKFWIILSVISYVTLVYAYSIILSHKNIAIVYPVLKVLSVLIVIITGLLVFNNKLDFTTMVGIFLGISSIYLLSSKLNNSK
jgi:multidrug transporter EmrE-like cation transporter